MTFIYNFLTTAAEYCNTIFIPIGIVLIIFRALGYLKQKTKLYKTIVDALDGLDEASIQNTKGDILQFKNKGGSDNV
jgi:hypothetical protein